MNSPSPLEAIFFAALEKGSPAERAAYLDTACAGDPGCRRRVEKMLSAQAQAGSFLESPAAAQGATIDLPPAAERPGTAIGPYKLLEQIGEGGFGTVFLAEQTEPVRRKVAVKVIKAGMDTRQVVARFEAERQALAVMDHPNIAKVFDGGQTATGRPYFVMELVRGVPITDYCDQAHLPPRGRLELFVQVCQAVQHAHQKGIIHRDIKPSNVLVSAHDGRPAVKVIDFGIAKAAGHQLTDRTLFTNFAQLVGTPLYMSPEQAAQSPDIDTRSDIYSLGVLLYELLTGSTPFNKERFKQAAYEEIRRIIREEEPPKPSTRLSDSKESLPSISALRHTEPAKLTRLFRGEVDWIVMKALEKDRGRRYETATGFAADVQRYLADDPVQACPPSAGYRFRKFARRNKRALATAVVVAAALVTGTAVSAWQAVRATGAERLAGERLSAETEAERATQAQLLLTRAAEEKATRQLFDARLAQARAGALSRRVGQRIDGLTAVADATAVARGLNLPEDSFLDLRNAAISCLALPDLRLARQWAGWPAGSGQVDFDGRLEHYARTDASGAVSIRRVADDVQVASLPPTGGWCWALFTRDGRFVSVHSVAGLKVWRWAGPAPVAVLDLPYSAARTFDVSPDGRVCVTGAADGAVTVHDLATGRPPRPLPPGTPVLLLEIHPDGRKVAVSGASGVEVRDLETGQVDATLPLPAETSRFAWHPDGRTLATACNDSRVYLWDTAAGKPPVVLDGLRNAGIQVAFNHAGTLLATTGWEGKLRLWDPRTGRQLFSMTTEGVGIPRFGLDDRLLAGDLRGDRIVLWEIAPGLEHQTLDRSPEAMPGPDYHATVHPGGRLLAVGMAGVVGVWDLARGRELAGLALPGGQSALFDSADALLTNGPAGLFRWPVRADPADPGVIRIGPPLKLAIPGSIFNLARSLDGRVLASAQYRGGAVLHAGRPESPVRLGPHDDARYVAVSPDGKLAATSSHDRGGVRVWDTATGALVKALPDVGWGAVHFSPDGKWLAAAAGGYHLWAVGSWRDGPDIGGVGMGMAFSPDGRVLAVETGSGAVRLVDPDTGREYARLQDPDQDRAGCIRFTPDGTRLVAASTDSRSVHVWDLRAIRQGLAEMKLDWHLPPYPPAERVGVDPLRVVVDPG